MKEPKFVAAYPGDKSPLNVNEMTPLDALRKIGEGLDKKFGHLSRAEFLVAIEIAPTLAEAEATLKKAGF
jgi:hypothetical protein